MWVKKQELALDMEQLIGSVLRKEYDRAVWCLFNLYAEHIMRNAGLDKLQAGIKTGGRNINNLRFADDTTLMPESEGELRILLMRKKESGRVRLNLRIKKKTKN